MQDFFYEETSNYTNVKSESFKYMLFKVFSIISYVIAFIAFFFIFYMPLGDNALISIMVYLVFIALFIVSGVIFGKIKFRYCSDYDYTFVTGSIRVSRVSRGIKRKPIIKFETSDIIKLGKIDSSSYDRYFLSKDVKKMLLTSNSYAQEGKDFYYMYINNENGKFLLVFECTEIFIVNVLKFSSKTIIDEELKK